jgi:hypothetical protein
VIPLGRAGAVQHRRTTRAPYTPAGVIAESLGYDTAHDEWPKWIDDWASEVERQ